MKIVVLDGHTLNPGDLSWDALAALGECTVYDRTPPGLVAERAAGAEVVLTNKTVLSRDLLAALGSLRYVGVLATGYNVVDTAAARERDIVVTNIPAYGTRAVAQMTFALILELAQHVGHHAETVRQGRWSAAKDFCYWDFPLIQLEDRTLGIIGFGRIGRTVAEIGRAFGMKILAYEPQAVPGQADGATLVDLDMLFRESDIVSLHCPLTDVNRGFVNRQRLAMMKSGAFLINTSRGPLVDEPALAEALNAGRLAGAGLDVLSTEPPPPDNPLLNAQNCLITPHIAWATHTARERLMGVAVQNVAAFLVGAPVNRVG